MKTADRVTLYASSSDEALALSKQVHGYPRAGESGDQLVVVPGIDTIDVSAVNTGTDRPRLLHRQLRRGRQPGRCDARTPCPRRNAPGCCPSNRPTR